MSHLDQDTRLELMDAFKDLFREAESALGKILTDAENEENKHALFRAVHNIKGNAGMMQLPVIVTFTHELEEVVGALRRSEYSLTQNIAEILLIGLDRLQDLHEKELFGAELDSLSIDQLVTVFQAMAASDGQEQAEKLAIRAINSLSAGVPPIASSSLAPPNSAPTSKDENRLDDLIFFQELAIELDMQVEHWQGRSAQLFDWAMQMNQLAGTPVNSDQLAAGIYMHDIGMSLVERSLWEKRLDKTPEKSTPLFNHPKWAHGFLKRIPGWEDAANIVLHHHEYNNGSGFPQGLRGEDIHPGAKILSILDNFFVLTNGRVDASVRHSTVRAVSAINARLDTHFEGLWVQCFNHIIRTELRSGNL